MSDPDSQGKRRKSKTWGNICGEDWSRSNSKVEIIRYLNIRGGNSYPYSCSIPWKEEVKCDYPGNGW
jgi:hypothetical protein